MGIDDLGRAATPQKDELPLSQRSPAWWIFYMPGKVILWFGYMFPSSIVGSFAGVRQRNVPLIQLGYSILFYVVIAFIAVALKIMYENGQPDETAVVSPPTLSREEPSRILSIEQPTVKAEQSSAAASDPPSTAEIADPMKEAIKARLSPQFTACMNQALATPDMLECISVETTTQDAALNATYKRVMGKLPPEGQATLRRAQRDWIKERDARCDKEASESFGPVAHADCYLQREVERTIQLEQIEPR